MDCIALLGKQGGSALPEGYCVSRTSRAKMPKNAASKPAISGAPTAPTRALSGRRKWLFRLAAVVLGPILFFGVLELALRLGGYGYSTNFFLDGSAIEGRPVWMENMRFNRWVFPRDIDPPPNPVPFILPKEKADKTYRIFVLGESAAMGFPDPSMSFARVLEVMLRARYPDIRFEVINASMVAINSHVVLQIARQCAACKPDLFIVHLGNNEVVGPYGAAGVLGPFSPSLPMIRTNMALKSTRTGQLIERLMQSLPRKNQGQLTWEGMLTFINSQIRADDSRMPRIYSHYEANLRDICRVGQDAGIPVVLCTIPVNLKDCAPFQSLHAPALDDGQLAAWEQLYQTGTRLEGEKKYADAIRSYQEADRLDPGYAEIPYRTARCLLAQGDNAGAGREFARARDLDVLRFRTDSHINGIIRDMVASHAEQGVRLADAEQEFARASSGGIAGEEFFLEHVHMNFKGNWLLARVLFDTISNLAPTVLEARAAEPGGALAEELCARRLARTEWDEFKLGMDLYEPLIRQPPFTFQYDHHEQCQKWEQRLGALDDRLKSGGIDKAISAYQAAVQANPQDWMLRANFGRLLSSRNRLAEAQQQYREVLRLFHHNWEAYVMVGGLDLKLNQPRDAEKVFRQGIQLDPLNMQLPLCLADALEAQGKYPEARTILDVELQKHPSRVDTLRAIGRFLYRRGKLEESKARLNLALQRRPRSADVHLELSALALREDNVNEAIRLMDEALELRPDWPDLRKQVDELKKKRQQNSRN
jgi:tetratricopeptide (TPR) repeat protein